MALNLPTKSLVTCLWIILTIKSIECFLPSSIKACSRNNPEIEKCILNTVDSIRPLLAKGDFGENFQVPALEPLKIENIHMRRGQEFNATFSNLYVSGPSNFVVEKLKVDPKNLVFDFVVLLPKLEFTGKYSLKIKLVVIDIRGKGDMRGSFKNARGQVKARARLVEKAGVQVVQFHPLEVKIKIGDSKVKLDNLFNGDPILGQVGNQFINDNTELFLNEIIPGLEKSLSKTFTDIANSVLKTTTYDEMFPDV